MEEKPYTLSPKAKKILIFWARMLGWLLMACVVPIVVFATRFGLFTKNVIKTDSLGNVIETQSLSLNGWGLLACIIIGFTVSSILKEIIATQPKYSLAKQWFTGFRKTVLPLLIGFFICFFINNVVQHLMFCLGTLALCEFIAVPLNPLPKWRYEKTGVEDYASVVDYLTNAVKQKTSKKENGIDG